MHNVSIYVKMVLYLKRATDITKYPKLSKVTNFCDSRNVSLDFLDFLLFSDWMSWNLV